MKWPQSVAPFELAIIPSLKKNDNSNYIKAKKIYDFLIQKNIDTVLDDTEEHLSAKFKKFDLIGVPYQVIIGSKPTDNEFEFKEVDGKAETLSIDAICKKIINNRNLN